MTERVFLGMLTPSSNTILEPVTTAMISGLPEVTAHFSRFKVTEIALSGPALAQFDDSEILRAAELLAHAKVNVIAWNGTSSGWLGFERDVQLCERITQATGIPACTAMLALNELLEKTGAKRVGFVTPYLDDVQARINANYEKAGWTVASDRHLGMQDNFSFSTVTADQMRVMTRDVAAREARRDRDHLHQHARRAARRGAGGRVRHPDLRHGLDHGVEEPADRRRRYRAREGLGPVVFGLMLYAHAGEPDQRVADRSRARRARA